VAQYRSIVGRKTQREPNRTSVRGRLFTWRAGTDVTTVTLSCGHTKVYRGFKDSAPKEKALCHECP
jgi:hypothetical protein